MFDHKLFSLNAKGRPGSHKQAGLKFIDVGTGPDSMFISIAAGIIDNVSTNHVMNSQLLNKLLDVHLKTFPDQARLVQYTTDAAGSMNALIQATKSRGLLSSKDLLYSLGVTLRRIAVTEMVAELCKNSDQYKYLGAFNEGIAPKNMLQSGIKVDELAVGAIARVLNLPIEVQVCADRQPLRARFLYAQDDNINIEPNIVLSLENGQYSPGMINSNMFQNLATTALKPIQATEATLPDIQLSLQQIRQRIQEIDAKNCKLLITMFNNNEIDKDWLLNTYISHSDRSSYLNGFLYHCGNV